MNPFRPRPTPRHLVVHLKVCCFALLALEAATIIFAIHLAIH
jgi:hypothetical protein